MRLEIASISHNESILRNFLQEVKLRNQEAKLYIYDVILQYELIFSVTLSDYHFITITIVYSCPWIR